MKITYINRLNPVVQVKFQSKEWLNPPAFELFLGSRVVLPALAPYNVVCLCFGNIRARLCHRGITLLRNPNVSL
jgi:hypothetical protein